MVIDARIPMSGNPVNFFDMYTTGVQRGQQQKANALAMQQAETAGKEQALQRIARGVLGSNDPAAAYKQGLAVVAQMGGKVDGLPPEWGPDAEMVVRMYAADPAERTEFERITAGLSPEEAKRALMIKLGMEPDANTLLRGEPKPPTDPTLIREIEAATGYPRGSPEFMKEYERRTTKSGMTVFDPTTGKPLVSTGGADGNIPLEKKNRNDVVGGLVNDYEMLNRVNMVAETAGIGPDGRLTPEGRQRLTYLGKYGNTFNAILEKAGVDLSEEDKQALRDYTSMRHSVEQLFNVYRKEITGAAAAVQELDRLLKSFINADLSPSEFEGAYNTLMTSLKRSIRLRNKFLRQGISNLDDETSAGARAYDRAWASGMDDAPEARFTDLVSQGMPEEEAYKVMESEGY